MSKTLVCSPPRYAKSSGRYSKPMAKTPIQAVSIQNSEFGIALGNQMFRNEDFERRMAEVQRQIEEIKNAAPKKPKMLHEQSPSPKKNALNDDIFAEFDKYDEKPKKHASPTRRLRQQKDAAVEQKGYLSM